MTEPGAVEAPSPGWWVRTNRIGTDTISYGFIAYAEGLTPARGDVDSDYAWAGSAVGQQPGVIGQGSAAYVAANESTSAGSYVDLTTTTDSVTVTVPASGIVLVSIYACIAYAYNGYVSYALSGANTRAANNNRALYHYAGGAQHCGATFLETGLTPGSTTFKMKYWSDNGSSFQYRRIAVNSIVS